MLKEEITIALEIESDDARHQMRRLSDVLSEFEIRPYLSSDSIQELRSPDPDKHGLMVSIDSRAIASLVREIIRWQEDSGEKLIMHVGETKITISDKADTRKLLDLVRDGIERLGSKSIGITGPHGPGGSWDS